MATKKTGITLAAEGEKEFRSAISGINTSMKELKSSLKLVAAEFGSNGSSMKELTSRQKLLNEQVEMQQKKVETLRKAVAESSETYGENSKKTLEWKNSLNNAETDLIKLTDQLKETNKQIDNFSLNKITSSLDNFGEKSKTTGAKLEELSKPFLAISAAGAGAGIACAKMSSDFDDAFAKVTTIADESEMPLDELKASIIDLSNETGISASDIADNVYNAISAGQKTGDAVNFVRNSTELATAGFAESSASLDVLTTILNAYGMEANQVTNVSDMLVQTQNKGKTTVGDLSSYMGKAIPTANAYHVGLDNVCTSYAILTSNGIQTADSTTYLNSLMNELGKSSTGVSKVLKEKTGKSFADLMSDGNSLGDVLGILQSYCDETGTQFTDLWQSAEAGKAALTLTKDGADGFNASLTDMQNCTGATGSAFDKMKTDSWNLNNAINEVKNTAIDFGNSIMQVAGPEIKEFCDRVKEFSAWFSTLNDGQKEAIVKIGLVAIAIGPLLNGTGKLIGNIGNIATGASTVLKSFGKIGSGASSAAEKVSTLSSAAGKAAGPTASAGEGMGAMAKNAVGLLAAGAGILLAAGGLAILAKAAIELAKAGPEACIAMVGLVAALAIMALGAAALAPALTAGAVGLVAFGAGLALIGVGVLAASGGMAILANKLPIISEYGGSAALNILALSGSLLTYGVGAMSGGTASIALGAGLLVAAGGFVGASAAVTLFAGAVALGTTTCALTITGLAIALGTLAQSIALLRVVSGQAQVDVNGNFVNMSNGVGNSVDGMSNSITGGFDSAFGHITSLPVGGWGADLMSGMADGIKSGIGYIKDTVIGVADTIKSFLHFSVPDEGPLTDYESWMPDFMGGMAEGIEKSKYKVTDAVKNVASGIKSDMNMTVNTNGTTGGMKATVQEALGNMQLVAIVNVGNKQMAKVVTPVVVKEISHGNSNKMAMKGALT